MIHPDFVVYNVATHDGRLLTGVLTEESATSLTLRKEQAASETVLRREIERIESSTRSLMPDGMEKEISPQDLADLIAYIRSATGTALPPGEVLFDEQSAIVDWLTSGDGTASLCKDDRFAGDLSLRVHSVTKAFTTDSGLDISRGEGSWAGRISLLEVRLEVDRCRGGDAGTGRQRGVASGGAAAATLRERPQHEWLAGEGGLLFATWRMDRRHGGPLARFW